MLSNLQLDVVRIEKANIGMHSASIVHFKWANLSGYMVIPNTEVDKVNTLLTTPCIIESTEVLPNVTIQNGSGKTNDAPEPIKGSTVSTDTGSDSIVKVKRLHRNRNSNATSTIVETTNNNRGVPTRTERSRENPNGNSSNNLPRADTVIKVKRTRRTKEEMRLANAKASISAKSTKC